MGGGQSTNSNTLQWTNQLSQNILPEWVKAAGQSNYGLAQKIAGQNWDPARGQTVAPFNADQNNAFALARNSVGNWQPMMNGAAGTTQGLMGWGGPGMVKGVPMVSAGQLATTDLKPYMDPYVNDVIKSTQAIANQSLAQSNSAAKAAAAGSGGFGGSREAITEGVNSAQTNMGMANLSNQMYSDAFRNAQEGAKYDIGNRLQADEYNTTNTQNRKMFNKGLALDSAKLRLGAAGQLANMAGQYQGMTNRDIQSLMASGAIQQGQAQNVANANTANANARYQDSVQKLNMLMSALGATPYESAQRTTGVGGQQSNQTTSNGLGLGQLLTGGLEAIKGLFGTGGAFASGGALAPMMGFLSDDNEKTDVQKIGNSPDGVGLYAFRYKGDPKSYPKVVGPMASEVQAVRPSAVKEVTTGRKPRRIVDYSQLRLGVA